jgi:hypothetical protein
MMRNSERSTLKTCEFRWHIIYERQLQPHYAAPALRFGTLIHAALAAYYKPGIVRGPAPAKTFERLYKKELTEASKMGFKDEDGTWHEAGHVGVSMMENYVDHFGKDDEWEVLFTERPFEVVVYHPLSYDPNHPPEAQAGAKPWFKYVGVLDGGWRNRRTKHIWIPDHKTTKGIGGTTEHPKIPVHLRVDDQAGGYWSWGVDSLVADAILRKNEKLAGMLYNFLRKAISDERPFKIVNKRKLHLNQDGSISKKQPSPYLVRIPIQRDTYDRQMAKDRSEADYERIEMLLEGRLTPTKSPGMFTCPMCPVLDICELHETGHDYESMIKSTMQVWDPYAEHEILEGR